MYLKHKKDNLIKQKQNKKQEIDNFVNITPKYIKYDYKNNNDLSIQDCIAFLINTCNVELINKICEYSDDIKQKEDTDLVLGNIQFNNEQNELKKKIMENNELSKTLSIMTDSFNDLQLKYDQLKDEFNKINQRHNRKRKFEEEINKDGDGIQTIDITTGMVIKNQQKKLKLGIKNRDNPTNKNNDNNNSINDNNKNNVDDKNNVEVENNVECDKNNKQNAFGVNFGWSLSTMSWNNSNNNKGSSNNDNNKDNNNTETNNR